MNSIFATLKTTYATWPALKAYLTSEEGGSLRIEDASTAESPFALIRYVKGRSNMTLPHVRAFRSVVWDTLDNIPVSVTPYKSADGECLPAEAAGMTGLRVEHFVDGVMIGVFWDRYAQRMRIHTRSCMDGLCRYYSQTKPFSVMFYEAVGPAGLAVPVGPGRCYTYILQHPENRIVTPTRVPRLHLVQATEVDGLGGVRDVTPAVHPLTIEGVTSWADLRAKMQDWNMRFRHAMQGVVVKNVETGERWKIRTPEYNRVRKLRGNSPRRDFLWLNEWRNGTLPAYLDLYPEERADAEAVVGRWKRATTDVYQYYTDVFKARTLPKTAIPAKYRPLVYGLHTLYMETLKPARQTVTWPTVLRYMNDRDTAQMLFVINWELRLAAAGAGAAPAIPIEPPSTLVTAPAAGVAAGPESASTGAAAEGGVAVAVQTDA